MSSHTWTHTELLSNAATIEAKVWRMVEAQHVVSTNKLVDSHAEQEALEDILEKRKPDVPPAAADLSYLLYSPFRYETRSPQGSRFRAPTEPGVFYGAKEIRTAAAEVGYWRLCFLRDTEGLERLQPCRFTAFSVLTKARAINLQKEPFCIDRKTWTHPTDYSKTQALARTARAAGVTGIAYESVRDPSKGTCLAILSPEAFAQKKPDPETHTWTLTASRTEIFWSRQKGETFLFALHH